MDLSALMQMFGPLQERMRQADAERRTTVIEGSAGGGAVSVRLQGDLSVKSVTIAPAAAAAVSDDPTMLEDLIAGAVNNALQQYAQRFGNSPEEQLQKVMGDADLGGMLGGLM